MALLTRFRPASETDARALELEYERSLSRRARPGGWERMDAAMTAGWAGIEPEEMVANIYHWRQEGRRRDEAEPA